MQSKMPFFDGTGAGLQKLQAASWYFPPQDVLTSTTETADAGTSLLGDPATTIAPSIELDGDAILLPSLSPDNTDLQHGQTIALPTTLATTPLKTPKKSKKRKNNDPDGDFKSSITEKKKRTSPTATAKPKPKRKTNDYYEETDYKPTTKRVAEYTVDDEIADDADICFEECAEKDEQDMIHCDGEACRLGGKWFHTRCVGFGKVLPSNMDEFDWYCPNCREEFGVGKATNGLVPAANIGKEGGEPLAIVSD